jgi:hypothetical protein
MTSRNVKKSRLKKLIKSVTDEILMGQDFLSAEYYNDHADAVHCINQLIELAGKAALALGLEEQVIDIESNNFQFTLSTKFIEKRIAYLYRITCVHPTKCNGMIYYGKHRSTNPESRQYMGGGELLRFAQNKLGKKHFTKEVIQIYPEIESAERAEEKVVNADFVASLNNFNLALGGRNVSLEPSVAHPLKIRLLKWFRDLKKAGLHDIPVWLYRKIAAEQDEEVQFVIDRILAKDNKI